jgi:hypothetical protein
MMCIQTLQGVSKPASSEKQLENTLNTCQIIVGEWNQGGVNHYIYIYAADSVKVVLPKP